MSSVIRSVVFWPLIVSFLLTIVGMRFGIPIIRNLKLKQYEREEGLASHKKKGGTPTMGGSIFLVTIFVTTIIFVLIFTFSSTDYTGIAKIFPVLLVTLGFGIIGFLDDYIKVIKKRNLGLTEIQKLIGEIGVTLIFAIYVTFFSGNGTEILIPFSGGIIDGLYWDVPAWFYIICLFIIVLGTVNGSNFTDGLDGLLSGVTVVIAAFLAFAAYISGSMITAFCAIVIGALLAFLVFNAYPAKIFMGDTGSLALGGFVAATSYMLKIPIFIAIVAFIYLLEILSVMIQVTYFKATGGKRIFKMAPIHHHFEMCGWHETRVVAIFMIVTAILCSLGVIALV